MRPGVCPTAPHSQWSIDVLGRGPGAAPTEVVGPEAAVDPVQLGRRRPVDFVRHRPSPGVQLGPVLCAQPGDYSSAGSIAEYGETVRLAGYWIAFHEYAHHVQRRIDVLAAAYTRDEDQLQISRRIELQADCFMAMTGIAIRNTGLNADDRAEMRVWRNAVPDEIHGRSASQLFWIERGFGTDDFGRCSTWTANKHIR